MYAKFGEYENCILKQCVKSIRHKNGSGFYSTFTNVFSNI